jgi:hypothetical protein
LHENPSSGSRVVLRGRTDGWTDRQTDMTKLIVAFRNFANALTLRCRWKWIRMLSSGGLYCDRCRNRGSAVRYRLNVSLLSVSFFPSFLLSFLVSQFLLTHCRCRVYWCIWSHSDTPRSVGLLWTRDRPVAETPTWQHIQHSQGTGSHVPGGIQTHNPSKRPPCWTLYHCHYMNISVRFSCHDLFLHLILNFEWKECCSIA